MAKPLASSLVGLCPDHREHGREFAKLLEGMCRREGWRLSDGLSRYLEAAYRALRGRLTVGQANVDNEAAYMRIVERCQHKTETMSDMSKMLGTMTLALRAEPRDFLGPIFSEVAANEALGQFFTPWDVSVTMARMVCTDAAETLAMNKAKGQSFIACQEPACGVGGMILAANSIFKEQGLNCATDVHWIATDKDFNAYCGAFLQCELAGHSAVIVHGDTLRLEEYASQATRAAIIYPKRFPRPSDGVRLRERPVKLRTRVQPVAAAEPVRLRERPKT